MFRSGSVGILATLSNLISEFATGASTAAIAADTGALTTGPQNISQQRVLIDKFLTALQSSNTYAQSQTAHFLQAAQDSLIQTNPTQVATELSATETQHTSLIDMIASLDQQTTLFNMLK